MNYANGYIMKSIKVTKNMLIMRGLIGAILLYFAFSILDTIQESKKDDQLIFMIFIGLFTVVGIFLILVSTYQIYKKQYAQSELVQEQNLGNYKISIVDMNQKQLDALKKVLKSQTDLELETMQFPFSLPLEFDKNEAVEMMEQLRQLGINAQMEASSDAKE